MTLSRRQITLLHTAKSKLGLSETEYRSALVHLAGVESATELDQAGFELLLAYFEYCGFAPLDRRGPDYGKRPGMASFAQLELIRTLWREFTRGAYGGEDELNSWLLRSFKVSSLRFLTAEAVRKAITGL